MLATDLGSKRIHVPGNLLVGDAGKDGSLAVGFDSRSLSEEEHLECCFHLLCMLWLIVVSQFLWQRYGAKKSTTRKRRDLTKTSLFMYTGVETSAYDLYTKKGLCFFKK